MCLKFFTSCYKDIFLKDKGRGILPVSFMVRGLLVAHFQGVITKHKSILCLLAKFFYKGLKDKGSCLFLLADSLKDKGSCLCLSRRHQLKDKVSCICPLRCHKKRQLKDKGSYFCPLGSYKKIQKWHFWFKSIVDAPNNVFDAKFILQYFSN